MAQCKPIPQCNFHTLIMINIYIYIQAIHSVCREYAHFVVVGAVTYTRIQWPIDAKVAVFFSLSSVVLHRCIEYVVNIHRIVTITHKMTAK